MGDDCPQSPTNLKSDKEVQNFVERLKRENTLQVHQDFPLNQTSNKVANQVIRPPNAVDIQFLYVPLLFAHKQSPWTYRVLAESNSRTAAPLGVEIFVFLELHRGIRASECHSFPVHSGGSTSRAHVKQRLIADRLWNVHRVALAIAVIIEDLQRQTTFDLDSLHYRPGFAWSPFNLRLIHDENTLCIGAVRLNLGSRPSHCCSQKEKQTHEVCGWHCCHRPVDKRKYLSTAVVAGRENSLGI